jgi:hypothetical protein
MGEMTYYRRYVYEITIISDQNKINEDIITGCMNYVHKRLEFNLTAGKP